MTRALFVHLAMSRLFQFAEKLYFPEFFTTGKPVPEAPFRDELIRARMDAVAYLDRKPFGMRLSILLSVYDNRELRYLRLGERPKPIAEELEDALKEMEAIASGKPFLRNVIGFPPSEPWSQDSGDS